MGGSAIASKTYNNPSEASTTGWRTISFDSAVDLHEGVDYIVWSHLPGGNYAVDPAGETLSFTHASFGGSDKSVNISGQNGYYEYTSTASTVPSNATYSNYWVGPVTSDATNPQDVSSFAASDNSAGPAVSWSNPAYDNNSTYSSDSYAVYTNVYRTTGGNTQLINRYDGASGSVSFNDATALPGTTYTYSAKSVDPCGNESTGTSASSFTTSSQSLEKLFSATPASTDVYQSPQVLGMHWQTDTAGSVWGARIYRAANTWPTNEPLKVFLWDNDGTVLASRELPQYSEQSGWIDVRFSSPVSVSASHDYVVGYYAPNGQTSYTTDVFDSAVSNGNHLTGRQDTGSTYNGVYAQGMGTTSSTFPTTQAPDSSWYGVDVDFYVP